MSRRVAFVSGVLGTAALVYLAQRVEYLGFEYTSAAGTLAFSAVIAMVALPILAARLFTHATAIEVVLASAVVAGMPFLIELLLRIGGTQLNIHGFAIGAYFLYVCGSELCAIGLVIALIVRSVTRWKRRAAA